jgi:hypothetical protein
LFRLLGSPVLLRAATISPGDMAVRSGKSGGCDRVNFSIKDSRPADGPGSKCTANQASAAFQIHQAVDEISAEFDCCIQR